MIRLMWTQCLKLWDQHSTKLDGTTLQYRTQCQRDKLVTKIRQLHFRHNELLVADRKWLMDDPSTFLQTAKLNTLCNWINIYKPVLTECFRLAKAATTSNTLPLTIYFLSTES